MSLLKRIGQLRFENGNMSVNKLEREAGLTRGSMAKWDDHPPSYEKLKKVADYFSVSVAYLTGEEPQGIKKDPTQTGEVGKVELLRSLEETDDTETLLDALNVINRKLQERK